MSRAIETYLDRVMAYANQTGQKATAIRKELCDHLLEKVDELEARGVPIEDAVFQAVEENGRADVVGHGLRPKFPWIDVRTKGTARGVIAIGPKAIGVFAFGGMAIGVFAIGGLAIGVFGMGGLVLAALFGFGSIAVVPLGFADAGIGIGLLSASGVAIGVIAGGWVAIGCWAGGDYVYSLYAAQTAPRSLRWIDWFFPSSGYEQAIFVAVLVCLFLSLQAASLILMARERRRISKVDSTVAD